MPQTQISTTNHSSPPRKLPIFYGAIMLTGVNFLLRFIGTSFQVYLSSTIGAAGVGLLQLVLSVFMLAMTAGIAGIRTTTMYLIAEELGKGRKDAAASVLRGCLVYGGVTSTAICLVLYFCAPAISRVWIADVRAIPALRTAAAFLPVGCLCGVMTGYFTAANRIGTLTVVEVGEQIFSMAVTVLALMALPTEDMAGACRAVVLGNCMGYSLTLGCLVFLYFRWDKPQCSPIAVGRRICSAALPLALADDLKAGISALENLMVPKRLALFPGMSNSLAAFGMLTGMVFPVMMFPAAILSSLAELLIPELARCAAVGSKRRIEYLVRRNLRVTLFYGLTCASILFLVADPLCEALYPGMEVSAYLKCFAALVPMLYCDLIVDSMTKGLGQQRYCVRYNILSNTLDVLLLFFLLPTMGIRGYFLSFSVTHGLNFMLSLRRLSIISRVEADWYTACMSTSAALLSIFGALSFTGWLPQVLAFAGLFFCISFLLGILSPMDILWVKNLLLPQSKH